VRMAIGARPLDVTRMIVGRGLRLGVTGLLIGALLAFGLGRLLQTLLFGVKPAAPIVYVATAGILLLVALAACVIPAQRAAHVDPVIALRSE
jgi:putative ABC transport system permease protein